MATTVRSRYEEMLVTGRSKYALLLGLLCWPLVLGANEAVTASPTWEANKPNEHRFDAIEARFVRFNIARSNSQYPILLDELEVLAAEGGKNVALSSAGAKATASSSFDDSCGPEKLIDGAYGPSKAWKAKEYRQQWVTIELPESTRIDRVVWSHERTGTSYLGVPTEIGVDVSLDGKQWKGNIVRDQLRIDTPGSKVVPAPALQASEAKAEEPVSKKAAIEKLLWDTLPIELEPVEVRQVRILIRVLGQRGRQMLLDEVALFAPQGQENLALASHGTTAAASSHMARPSKKEFVSPYHASYLNDGRYGDSSAWLSDEANEAWVELTLAKPERIGEVVLSTHRRYRVPELSSAEVYVSSDGQTWKKAASASFPYRTQGTNTAARTRADLVGQFMHVETQDDPFTIVLQRMEAQLSRLANAKIAVEAERKAFETWRAQIAAQDWALAKPREIQALYGEMAWAERRLALRDPALAGIEKILFVRRHEYSYTQAPNWENDGSLQRTLDALCILDVATGDIEVIYDSNDSIRDVELHWDAQRLLFSRGGKIFEYDLVKREPPQLISPAREEGWFDPCYLADGSIIMAGSASLQGVPCVLGTAPTCNLYRLDRKTGVIRQLTFDQEQVWNPVLREDGMVMYSRWDYMDKPHPTTRILMNMRPDGSHQRALYGSNWVWPAGIYFARQIPGQNSLFAAVTTGHHGPAGRCGDLVLFDLTRDHAEGSAAVTFLDNLERQSGFVPPRNEKTGLDHGLTQRRFIFPWPLDDQRFLVSKSNEQSDPFRLVMVVRSPKLGTPDTVLTLCGQSGANCLEAIPLVPRKTPLLLPDSIDLTKDYGTVMVADVYLGPGLAGVPRGTIKSLRLIEPYYTPSRNYRAPGVAGPWDMRRIIGTVPVEADGSAAWKAPANVPLAIHALDAEGKAVATMRSWYTAMPGERITCLGCHERPSDVPNNKTAPLAMTREPSTITPFYGPARGYAFNVEVQRVLDKNCVGCHDGSKPDRPNFASTEIIWAGNWVTPCLDQAMGERGPGGFADPKVSQSYQALQPFVRRPGPESSQELHRPMAWHADTSDLVQMLKKGHHGVKLDKEAWGRLVTWIDMNAPYHATWGDDPTKEHPALIERRKSWEKYAKPRDSLEILPERPTVAYEPPGPALAKPDQNLKAPQWPFTPEQAQTRVTQATQQTGCSKECDLKLDEKTAIKMTLIPAGEFVLGSRDGYDDEYPQGVIDIRKPFYLSVAEITNDQYALFDPQHDSGFFSQYGYFQGGYGLNAFNPDQPVLGITWHKAQEYCAWLSQKIGKKVRLPTEAEWEWACRAGSTTPLWYGSPNDSWVQDGKLLDNMADMSIKVMLQFASTKTPLFMPHRPDLDDKSGVTVAAKGFETNPFGLIHMHGNVREWTSSLYKPYPYVASDGREDPKAEGERVVRGGSFFDLPKRSTSSHRLGYPAWMQPWNVGFRVVCEVEVTKTETALLRTK